MKKIVISILVAVFMLVMMSTATFADEQSDWQKEYDELLNSSGASELYESLPDDAGKILQESGIDGIYQDDILAVSFFDIVKALFKSVGDSFKLPFSTFLCCIGITLLCALLNSMKGAFSDGSYDRAFSVMSVVCAATAIATPISNMIIKVSHAISQSSDFFLSFIPVYSGIVTASGKPLSATAYTTALFAVVQVIARISATIFVPMLGVYLAFCLIGSASHEIDITGIARTVKNIVITALSFLMTIFVGLLTVQGAVANSADTVGLKTAKFAINTLLPVVGSAVSEALNSVQGCIGVIKTTVGGFGIFAVASIFLPALITLLLLQLALFLSEATSNMLKTEHISSLLSASRAMLSLLIGLLVVFMVLFVVSIGVMVATASSG